MATKSEKARRKRRYSNAKETMTAAEEGYRPTAFKVPEGMSLFRFNEQKVYRIDVIPFVTGKGNPRADEGCDHFERTIYVHRNLGPNQESHLCLAKNFGKACPVCEHRQRISNDPDGDQELADKLKPQWRHLWLIYDYDDKDKGVQIMDTAHYKSFGEMLSNKVRAGDDDDNFENFHHLEDGLMLKVACEEDSFNGKTYFKPSNIEMKARKNPLDPSLTDDVPCLDDLLVELPYKKLKELLLAEPSEDEDEEEDEDEDSETSEDEDEEEKPTKKPGKKTGKKPSKPADEDEEDESEDEDDEEETGEDGESEEEEEEDEGPKFKKGDNVKGEYKDKKFTGKVIAIKNGLIHVDTVKGNLRVMSPDELELVSRPKEEDEEGEEEKPKPKKPGKTSKPTSPSRSKKDQDAEDEDDDIWDEDDEEEEAEEEEAEDEDEE